jgi:(2R)-sulfolactate sulfo-lyase subunit alpha
MAGGQQTSQAEPIAEDPVRADTSAPHFLIHNEGDHVGVAVQDVVPGAVRAVYMDSDKEVQLEASEPIPLSHKIALTDLDAGAAVIEYSVPVGVTRQAVRKGALVHIHNLRSGRWQQSQ